MIWCQSCSEEVAPVAAMNGAAQIVQSCPKCCEPIGNALTEPTAGFDKDKERVRPVGPPPKPLAEVRILKAVSKPYGAGEPLNTSDVIAQVRARLAHLDREIALRSGLEVEAKKLRRMLSAAERIEAKDKS